MVSTRLAAGSIAVISAWTNCTPGFTTSAYEWRTASAVVRPNMTSSLENPNTNPSALSMSTTSASPPNSSESRVLSSSPPNPAPRMMTRMTGNLHRPLDPYR